MHLENLFTALKFRIVDRDMPVETTRSHQRLIQNIGSVGTSKYNNMISAIKAIHLDQQLI